MLQLANANDSKRANIFPVFTTPEIMHFISSRNSNRRMAKMVRTLSYISPSSKIIIRGCRIPANVLNDQLLQIKAFASFQIFQLFAWQSRPIDVVNYKILSSEPCFRPNSYALCLYNSNTSIVCGNRRLKLIALTLNFLRFAQSSKSPSNSVPQVIRTFSSDEGSLLNFLECCSKLFK